MQIFLLEVLLPKVWGFFGALLKNKFIRIVVALLIAALLGAGIADYKVSEKYDAQIAKQQAAWKAQEDQYKADVLAAKALNQKVNTVVVTDLKNDVERVGKNKKSIDVQIDASKEVKDEDSKCSLGPDFVRLYNAANTGGSAASAASGTAQTPATPASSSRPRS